MTTEFKNYIKELEINKFDCSLDIKSYWQQI